MADVPGQLVTALRDRYRIERELGGGGMSQVFLAEETALGRKVVIKVLPPELAGALSPERFQREVRVAAGLQHPHIVPLLTAGEAGGVLYYTMPFVAGESLRAKLDREGALPVPEAVRYLRDVADALAGAHGVGIVHRDIKPDNVLITHHHAVVTDFGIAKALSEAGGGSTLTATGLAIGTPAYMAPEQVTGDSHLDHRADLYALGALGYEMLAGEPPFRGPNTQALLAAQLTRAPTPLADLRPNVPPPLAALIARCLEKLPADRFASAHELLAQLDALATPGGGTVPAMAPPGLGEAHPIRIGLWFAFGSLALLAAVYGLVHWLGLPDWVVPAAAVLLVVGFPIVLATSYHERKRGPVAAARASSESPARRLLTWRLALGAGGLAFGGLATTVAVFMGLRVLGVGPFATLLSAGTLKPRDPLLVADFENRTSDSTLGESVTEAVRIDLSRSHAIRLLETSSATAALRRMERDPTLPLTTAVAREVAERAGAPAIVTGEIASLGRGYVLSIRLLGSKDGATLLAERETAADAAGLIGAVDRLSRRLRGDIGESLRTVRAGKRLEEVTTGSLDALRLYSQAELASDAGEFAQSRRLLQQTLEVDSSFAMAWRKLGVVLANMGVDRETSLAAARRAFELRSRLPERERLLATAYYFTSVVRDPEQAIAAYRQLLETWPDDATANNNLALQLNTYGRFAEAEESSRRGIAAHPTVAALWLNLTIARMGLRQMAAAESAYTEWGRAIPGPGLRLTMGFDLAFSWEAYERADGAADSLAGSDDPFLQSFFHREKARSFRIRGRLAEADHEMERAMAADLRRGARTSFLIAAIELATSDVDVRGRAREGIGRLDSVLARHSLDSLPAADRPYLSLADFYIRAGALGRAERLVAEYDRLVPAAIRKTDVHRAYTDGLLAAERGQFPAARASFRAFAEVHRFNIDELLSGPTNALFEIGRTFEATNQPDSALATYEQLIASREIDGADRHWVLPETYRRLGELYEARGEKAKALRSYSKLVTIWKDADPVLQPVVENIRRRMATLAGEPVRP